MAAELTVHRRFQRHRRRARPRACKAGATLALVGRNAERLESVAQDCRARGAHCVTGSLDVRDRPALEAFLDGLGEPVGLFIANAGILDGRRDGETVESGAAAHRVLDTQPAGDRRCPAHGAARHAARRKGRLLLIASLAAFAPLPDAPAYSAAKAGLLSYGLALREALHGEGISVCVACPGYVTSAMSAQHLGHRPGEITADDAAARILGALERDAAVSGFPFTLYWSSRLSLWFRPLSGASE